MRAQKKYVSAKYDFAFKELMRNETVRRYFLADVLGLAPEEIKATRLLNTFLWQRYHNGKLGILDVLAELKDGTKVNIEIQMRPVKFWDRRMAFYLSKLYTDDLRRGEDFSEAKRAITINLLDYNLSKSGKYHRVCRLKDEEGEDLTDCLEVHVIELGKKLGGEDAVDDWIRLLNAETEEELAMIKTQNVGILEAIKELQTMSFGKSLRAWHESRLKYERDRRGELDYARDEGIEQGMERINQLYAVLQEQGRTEDISRAIADAGYREQLLEELKL